MPVKRSREPEACDGSEVKGDGPSSGVKDRGRIIIALDIDAFYVAASRIRDPLLKGLPIGERRR